MSDLSQFRDHCRKMAAADHKPDCIGQKPTPPVWNISEDGTNLGLVSWPGPPTCTGCIPDTDRAMFAKLAGEIEDYMRREDDEPDGPTSHSVDDVPLFGGQA